MARARTMAVAWGLVFGTAIAVLFPSVAIGQEANGGETWQKIASAFQPPVEVASDFGAYRSPLLFDDGSAVKTPEDWKKRREEILRYWHSMLGPWPALLEKPSMEILESKPRENFTQKKTRVEGAKDLWLDGYLMVPSIAGPHPAVLVVYYEPETGAGLNDQKLRDFAYQLARRGFVTLSIGWPRNYTDQQSPKRQPLSSLAYIAANCHTALVSLPEVDPKRVGVVGHSFGGKWAMFAACLYEKFACGAWSDPGIVFDETRPNVNYWEPWYIGWEPGRTRKPGVPTEANPRTGPYRQLVEQGRDLHELLALMAPRPLLVSGGSEDPPERWKALNHAVAVNRLLGCENRVAMTNRPAHSPTAQSNEQLYAFFEYALKPSKAASRQTLGVNVGDPQLSTDHPFWQGELSCSTFERLFKNQAELYARLTGRKADSDEDKALASWLWRNTHYFHCTLLPEPDVFAPTKHEVVRDYWTGLFAYGHGMCQENHYQYTAELEYLLGHGRARATSVPGHTSFEVWLTGGAYGQGKWVLLDSDIATVCFDKQQQAMMNIEELTKVDRKEYLTNRKAADNRGWLPELYPGDGVGTYTNINYYALLCGYAGAPPVVNLRAGETLRRCPRPGLGEGPRGPMVYWGISVDGMDGPNRHITYLNDPEKSFQAAARPRREDDPSRRARFGNAVFTYRPDFQSGSYRAAVAAEDADSVTFEHRSPYVIATKPAGKNCLEPGGTLGLVLNGRADCKVCVSTDGMRTFSSPVDFADGLDLTDLVKGRYQYWLKFRKPAAGLADKDIAITTRCMANGYVMPHLRPGGTKVTFNASGLAARTIGPQAEAIRQNLVDGGLDKPSLTVKLSTPRGEKIKTVCWAVRSPTGSPPSPDLAFKAEYSTDGKQWKTLRDDWRVASPVPFKAPDTWSQSFFYGVGDISDDGATAAWIRISNNRGKSYQMGQFTVVYETANDAKTRVTYCWDEGGQEKTAEHVYPAAATMDASWKIETGKESKLKWVEMTAVP